MHGDSFSLLEIVAYLEEKMLDDDCSDDEVELYNTLITHGFFHNKERAVFAQVQKDMRILYREY